MNWQFPNHLEYTYTATSEKRYITLHSFAISSPDQSPSASSSLRNRDIGVYVSNLWRIPSKKLQLRTTTKWDNILCESKEIHARGMPKPNRLLRITIYETIEELTRDIYTRDILARPRDISESTEDYDMPPSEGERDNPTLLHLTNTEELDHYNTDNVATPLYVQREYLESPTPLYRTVEAVQPTLPPPLPHRTICTTCGKEMIYVCTECPSRQGREEMKHLQARGRLRHIYLEQILQERETQCAILKLKLLLRREGVSILP